MRWCVDGSVLGLDAAVMMRDASQGRCFSRGMSSRDEVKKDLAAGPQTVRPKVRDDTTGGFMAVPAVGKATRETVL